MISLAQMGSKAPQQGSEGWHQQRKGRITGSKPAGLFFELKSKELVIYNEKENKFKNFVFENNYNFVDIIKQDRKKKNEVKIPFL